MKKEKKIYWVVWKQRFESGQSKSGTTFLKHALKTVFLCASLVCIFTGNAGASSQGGPQFIIGNPGNPTVSIPGKSSLWNNGVARLVNQVLNNIPPGGHPNIGVFDFKALEINQTTEFSSRFKEDFIILLAQVDSLRVKEVGNIATASDFRQLAEEKGLDFFVRGFYKHGTRGLSVWSQLISTSTGNIVSSGRVELARNTIYNEDLALLDRLKNETTAVRSLGHFDNYDESLDHLMALKPNESNLDVDIKTNKKEYRVGEKITFSVKADKPCYITLFNVGPDGEANIIFPNADSRDNFLKAGETHLIPAESSGMEFRLQGPAGLERLKAFVSLKPGTPLDLEMRGRFYSLEKNTLKGTEDLNRLIEMFSMQDDSEWNEAYMEVFIYEKNESIMRGSRKIPLIDKPDKPIDMIGTMGQEQERK